MIDKLLKKYQSLSVPVKASFWFLISAFMQKGISVITTPIFTRLLSTSEYGEYSVFTSWLGILTVVISLNLYSGVYMQGLVKYNEEKDEYSSSLQGLTLFSIALWTVVYFLFSKQINKLISLSTTQMLLMVLMIWTTATFNFWSGKQRVEFRYRAIVTVTIISSILKPVVGIIFVTSAQDKVTARIAGLALVEVLCFSWTFFYQFKKGKRLYIKRFWIHALSFNVPLIPHYLSQTVLNSSDRIMIGQLVGDSEAGIYSLAYSLSLLVSLFNTSLLQTLNPWIYMQIKNKNTSGITRIAYPSLLLIATVNILLMLVAPEMLKVFAPNEYSNALYIIPPVSMSVFFMFSYSLFADFEFYYEKTKSIAAATVIGAVLNIVLNYLFIPIFGYYAAGYTTLFCYICYAVFHYLGMVKICKDEKIQNPYCYKKLVLISTLFLLLGFIILFSYQCVYIRYALITVCCMSMFLFRKRVLKYVKNVVSFRKLNEKRHI